MDKKIQTILKCKLPGCHNVSGDVIQNPRAWDGWQVAPISICPSCIDEQLQKPVPVVHTNRYAGKVIHTLSPDLL